MLRVKCQLSAAQVRKAFDNFDAKAFDSRLESDKQKILMKFSLKVCAQVVLVGSCPFAPQMWSCVCACVHVRLCIGVSVCLCCRCFVCGLIRIQISSARPLPVLFGSRACTCVLMLCVCVCVF